MQNLPGVDGPVRDIAFAPNPGRWACLYVLITPGERQ